MAWTHSTKKRTRDDPLINKKPKWVPHWVPKLQVAGVLDGLASVAMMLTGAQPMTLMGNRISSPVGILHVGDLVVANVQGVASAAFIQKFFLTPDGRMWVALQLLEHLAPTICKAALEGRKECVVQVQRLLGAFPYIVAGVQLFLFASADCWT